MFVRQTVVIMHLERKQEETKMEGEDKNNLSYYKECLRNHAASLGSYATDGCGEFIPSVETESTPALQCAACGCHRNFHRKVTLISGGIKLQSCNSPGGSSSQRQNPMEVESREWEVRSPQKRLRTKFTSEQKEKMLEFANRLGWKMNRGKEEGNDIEGFCKGIGVNRKIFKVWMHNNKNNNTSYSS